jgi:hypothetical protein
MAVLIFSSVGPEKAFGPEAIAAMSEAYEAALEELHDFSQPQIAREMIARRIIAAASSGERDPVRLRAAALDSLLDEED